MKAPCLRLKLPENFFVSFNTDDQSNLNVSNTHPSRQDEPFQQLSCLVQNSNHKQAGCLTLRHELSSVIPSSPNSPQRSENTSSHVRLN